MTTIPFSNLVLGGVLFLIMLIWGVIARQGWIALQTGRAHGPIARLHSLLGIAVSIAYLTAGVSTLAPDSLHPTRSFLGAYLLMANDMAGFAAVAIFRHMAHYFQPSPPPVRARWLALNYGFAAGVSLFALVFPVLAYEEILGIHLYVVVTYGYMVAMFALTARQLRRTSRAAAWQAPFGSTARPLLVMATAAVACLITVLAVVLTQSVDAPVVSVGWLMALFGALVAAPFAMRSLGAVLRDTLVGIGFITTGVASALLLQWETSWLPEGERFWVQVFLGSTAGLLLIGVGLQWWFSIFDRIVFRRARNRQEALRTALHAISPDLGIQQCSLRGLAALTHTLQLEGAALIWRDGGSLTYGRFHVDELEAIWPRDAAADALAERTLVGGELSHLPRELRSARDQAGVVGVICVHGSQHLWGHILMRADLVGASFGGEELAAIEGFADQIGLVLDGAALLARSLEIERSLAHAEKLAAIGELTARVAHEIRNPATAARSLTQQLLKEDNSPFQAEHAVILESLDRIEHHVADLLRYARRDDPKLGSIDLAALARRTAEELRPSLRSAGIELVVQSPAALPAEADAEKLRQVLVNLIENARDALEGTCGTKEIRVELGGVNGNACIDISDTGPGIAEEHLEHIFESFFTLKEGGTGLGLAISKRTIEAHGGHIAASRIPGSGLRFHIDLPLATDQGRI
ncbi:MAG: ATP-binding protein [Deltaproteobacteria bacterium]